MAGAECGEADAGGLIFLLLSVVLTLLVLLMLQVGLCARQRTHFLLLRQKKVSKEKASRIRRPAARASCVARPERGAQKLGYRLKHLRP